MTIIRTAAVVLGLLAPVAPVSAQGYHWLRQGWHLTSSHLSGRLETLLESSGGKTEFIKAADKAVALQDTERNAKLARAFRALIVARDAQNPAWPGFAAALKSDLKTLKAVAARTTSEELYLEEFANVVFRAQ